MIVRILGEGQFDVAESALEPLNDLDAAVEKAIADSDETAFRSALDELLRGVRSVGVPHDVESFDESDLILPGADSVMSEVAAMLADDGLIPG